MGVETQPAAQGGAAERVQPQFQGSSTGVPLQSQEAPAPAQNGVPQNGAPPEPPPAEQRRVQAADLPPEALSARLSHARESAAREAREAVLRELGIDDPAKFKNERQKAEADLKRFRDEEERRKRAAMTESQRLQSDLAKEKAAREAAEARVRDLEETTISTQQEQVVQRAGLKVVNPKYYRFARAQFLEYVTDLERTDPKKLAELGERDVERFFRVVLKEYPEWAAAGEGGKAEAATKPAEQKQPVIVRKPLTNGAPPPRTPPAQARSHTPGPDESANGKTFRPGLPNSMSPAEVKAELRRRGMRSW